MENITLILAGITILFFLLMAIKQTINKKTREKFCVICLSISITWILLIALYFKNLFYDKIIIALLIGMSITGFFYYLESRIKKSLKIFRLPFILTLILIAYSILQRFSLYSLYLVIGVWILFGITFLLKNKQKFKIIVKKLIDCCKKW